MSRCCDGVHCVCQAFVCFVDRNNNTILFTLQDDLQAHVKISRSRTAANPRAGTANSLLTTMPCYMVSAYTQQASSGPDSASDSEGEQTTTEGSSSRSGTPSMASRSSSVSAVWEVPGKVCTSVVCI